MTDKAYRVEISEDAPGAATVHVCGGTSVAGDICCPNCGLQMFPVFRLNQADDRVSALGLWGRDVLEVLVCPQCGLFYEPYWIRYANGSASIVGGARDGGDVFQEIESPYEERSISLAEIAEGGSAPGLPLHQLGGKPQKGKAGSLLCPACNKSMTFGGIVDYDDLSVPLYEHPHRPVALIIGDCDCLHWYTCKSCSVIGLRWAR